MNKATSFEAVEIHEVPTEAAGTFAPPEVPAEEVPIPAATVAPEAAPAAKQEQKEVTNPVVPLLLKRPAAQGVRLKKRPAAAMAEDSLPGPPSGFLVSVRRV